MPPYKGKGKFKVTAEPGKELIIMFRMIPGNFAAEFSLPLPKMFNLLWEKNYLLITDKIDWKWIE